MTRRWFALGVLTLAVLLIVLLSPGGLLGIWETGTDFLGRRLKGWRLAASQAGEQADARRAASRRTVRHWR